MQSGLEMRHEPSQPQEILVHHCMHKVKISELWKKTLAGLKARLDGALGILGWGEVALPGAGGWS